MTVEFKQQLQRASRLQRLLKLQLPGVLLVLAGGALYTVGAIVYMRRRPDPVPRVFGYHELFHVLTLAATACLYISVAFFVLPLG
jgi:hemolysin III